MELKMIARDKQLLDRIENIRRLVREIEAGVPAAAKELGGD